MGNPPEVSSSGPHSPAPVVLRSGAPAMAFPLSWKLGLVVAVIMVVLALIGVGMSTSSRAIAPTYWMSLVPVYGLLCIGVAWYRARQGECGPRVVLRQVFHWLVIGGAVAVDFLLRGAGEESGMAAGLNALLLLSVGCFLAGVHFELLFTLVGLLLIVTLLVVVKANQYLWLVLIGGALITAAMFGIMRMINHRSAPHSQAG